MLAWKDQHSKEKTKNWCWDSSESQKNPRSDSQGCWIWRICCKCPITTLTIDRLSLLQGS